MLDRLTVEDLPESLIDVVDVIGIDSFKKLVKFCGGSNLYIPSENNLVRPIRNKIIRENFKGNYREISRKFGISEVQVRNIVNPRCIELK